jgi:medium-chain acyl-[acyl-carrier-protein] hydrolase
MNNAGNIDGWIKIPKPTFGARLRLFCFPFGGGGTSFYLNWIENLPSEVELRLVQLPGRERRLKERPFTHMSPLVAELATVFDVYEEIPCVFFGHSLGALIGFELARQLRRQKTTGPAHIFISGRRAPHLAEPGPPVHSLPQPAFFEAVRRYNGTPKLVFEEPELWEIYLPILRADFSVLETYIYKKEDPLDCPITAFGGIQDSTTGYEELTAWREHTCKEFRLKMFPGDHFYLKDVRRALLHEISVDVQKIFNFSNI